MSERTCSECGALEDVAELRPYGHNGALICFDCAFATPEAAASTQKAFHTALDAAEAESPIVMLTADGPKPVK